MDEIGGHLSKTAFDGWAADTGPARLLLLGSLHPVLSERIEIPIGVTKVAAPLKWLLDLARDGIELDSAGSAIPDISKEGSVRFGWNPSPAMPSGERPFVEIDCLHYQLRRIGAIATQGRRDVLTPLGAMLRTDPVALWEAASAGIAGGYGFLSTLSTAVLGSLMRDDLDDITAASLMCSAIEEAVSDDGVTDETWEAIGEGLVLVHTLLRALRMVVPHTPGTRPRLTTLGKVGAIVALRAAVIGRPLDVTQVAAWN